MPIALVEAFSFLLQKAKGYFLSSQIVGTFATLALVFFVCMAVRRISPSQWRAFFSRGVTTDVVYTLFYVGGVYTFLIGMPLYWLLSNSVARYAPWLRVGMMSSLNPVVHFIIYWMALDLVAYLVHRMMHGNRYLWEFHKVHHSQEQLTPLTNYRFHFLDIAFRTTIQYVPAIILGIPPASWVAVIWIQVALETITHGDLPWSYGPLGFLFTSPAFHRMHHSNAATHFGRNFGISFSVWDFVFGTATAADRPPDGYGLPERFPRGFFRQLITPFSTIVRNRIVRPERTDVNDASAARSA